MNYDEDEALAAMLGLDVDEYLMQKARDRRPSREPDEDEELPF